MLRASGNEAWKQCNANLAEATWILNTRGTPNHPAPPKTSPLQIFGGDKVPVLHIGNWLGKPVWISPPMGKGKRIHGIVFPQKAECTRRGMQKDGETWCASQGDLSLGENNLWYVAGSKVAGMT